MEQKESAHTIYTRFIDIGNTLWAIGKNFSNSEKVKKIIRSLLKEQRPKVIFSTQNWIGITTSIGLD